MTVEMRMEDYLDESELAASHAFGTLELIRIMHNVVTIDPDRLESAFVAAIPPGVEGEEFEALLEFAKDFREKADMMMGHLAQLCWVRFNQKERRYFRENNPKAVKAFESKGGVMDL